jgi:hypothetical protein
LTYFYSQQLQDSYKIEDIVDFLSVYRLEKKGDAFVVILQEVTELTVGIL